MHSLPDALAPLAAYRQWIVCQFVPDAEKPGKTHKYPLNIYSGKRHDAHDPSIWLDAQMAIATASAWGHGFGVGFAIEECDPFFFIDVDECLDASGNWTPIVHELCAHFAGAAVEVSQSGRGLHIIGTGTATKNRRKKDYTNKLFDLYTEKRFVALTGTNIVGNAATEHTPALHVLVEKYLKIDGASATPLDWTDAPCEDWNGPADDDALLDRAMRSQSAAAAFGNKASFRDLFECNVEMLAKCYPPDRQGDAYNASNVDRALAQHLAFWTGRDCERIERLMQRSVLVRDKWQREDYMRRTILSAVAAQRDVLTDKEVEPVAFLPEAVGGEGEAARAVAVTGATILGPVQQADFFKNCVYVVEQNRILVPGGYLVRAEQFKVIFGGYSFVMDNANERTVRDAYEAFTQQQAIRHPRADSTCFRPDKAFGEIVHDAGRSRVNVYWPIEVPRQVGDVAPFLTHLNKLLPDERDRMVLLSYMAACVQYRGHKIQWAPLLQGVEGNGKTLLTRCVAEAIGKRYVHWPKASKLTAQFNSWMLNRLFYGVEDIYVPGSRIDVIEELKPMITGEELEIEGKGVDQISADVCGNFMLNSNHKNAIPKTRNDRRFAIFFTAQQHAADLARDGMTGDYFPKLYAWLRNGGYAIVSELLHTFPIPDEYNPTTQCQRAPLTTSTEEAIQESLGSVEQEILEAVEQNTPGFCSGWVSSIALGALLDNLNASRRIPRNKRRELMQSLGYIYHPGLIEGRVNNTVLPDGGKPRLFIRADHADRHLTEHGAIVRAYSAAQGVGVNVAPGA